MSKTARFSAKTHAAPAWPKHCGWRRGSFWCGHPGSTTNRSLACGCGYGSISGGWRRLRGSRCRRQAPKTNTTVRTELVEVQVKPTVLRQAQDERWCWRMCRISIPNHHFKTPRKLRKLTVLCKILRPKSRLKTTPRAKASYRFFSAGAMWRRRVKPDSDRANPTLQLVESPTSTEICP